MKGQIRAGWRFLKKLWKDADAQDLVEYVLLLMMIGLAVVASVKSVAASIKNAFVKANVEMVEVNLPGNATGTVDTSLAGNATVDNAAANVNSASAAAETQAALNASSFNAALDDLAAAGALAAAAFADRAAAADASSSTAAVQAQAANQINNANNSTAQASRDEAAAAAGALTGFLF